jgi:hypothetical protein
MDGRIPAAIAIFAAGVGVGATIGREDAHVTPAAVSTPVRRTTNSVATDRCERDLADARAELGRRDKLAEDRETAANGVPLEWDDAVPAELQPKVVKEHIERAIKECNVPVDLIDWDCSEPPCLARMRSHGDWYSKLVGCPAWAELYDNWTTMANDTIPCHDGAEEMGMISPYIEWLDDDQKENWNKRFQFRIQRAKDTWPCGE